MMIAVCSNKVRPIVQNNRLRFGSQNFRKDTWHLLGNLRQDQTPTTLCGIDCSDWLKIGPVEELTNDCCERCRAKATPPPESERER